MHEKQIGAEWLLYVLLLPRVQQDSWLVGVNKFNLHNSLTDVMTPRRNRSQMFRSRTDHRSPSSMRPRKPSHWCAHIE
jgi:hypothetical protein